MPEEKKEEEKIWLKLPLKDRLAVELRYIGLRAQEIADRIEIPKSTVDGYFDENGRLRIQYEAFERFMNKQREEVLKNKLIEVDENIYRITTLVMRKFGQRVQDDEGVKLEAKDFKIAWEIQRVMQGLATDVKRQDMTFNQDELDNEAEEIRQLMEDNKKRKDKERKDQEEKEEKK